jgi:uncharacterized protein
MLRRRGLLLAAVCVACTLIVGRAWGALVGDHAWFDALGFGDVWWWQTRVSLVLKGVTGAVATVAMRLHFAAIRRSIVSVVVPGQLGDLEFSGAVAERTIRAVLWVLAAVVGALLTIPMDDWRPLALVLDAQPLGEADPYFLLDLAFWTAWLPFELQLYTWALVAHVVMSAVVLVGYVMTRGIARSDQSVRITRHARRHITVLGAILLALVAWTYRLDGFQRLVVGTGDEGMFGFADHRVGLPGALVMQVIALSAAIVVSWSAWSRQPRSAIAAVTTVLLMALVLRQGMPFIAQSIGADSDPRARELPYQATRASFTARAFATELVIAAASADTASSPVTPVWGIASLPRVGDGTGNTPLVWGSGATGLRAVRFRTRPTPGLLPRWSVESVDATENIAQREPDSTRVRTLPPIVVSDSGGGYAMISDPDHRIAAPSLATTSARVAQAWNQQNPRLAFGTLPTPSPVLVTVRNARERVARLLPTLLPGSDALPMLVSDSLIWCVDLYAATDVYPLSESVPFGDAVVNAAQPAGTALVNAHTGRVLLLLPQDPTRFAGHALRRYIAHGVSAQNLSPELLAALPPRADALRLDAAIAAHVGALSAQPDSARVTRQIGPMRGLSLVNGVLPDSALLGDGAGPVWVPALQTYAFTAAAVDARGIVRGVMIAPGGLDRRTRWRPDTSGIRYDAVVRATQETTDSLRQGPLRNVIVRGAARILPSSGPPVFVTPFYRMRSRQTQEVAAVLMSDGARRSVGPSVSQASVGLDPGRTGARPGSAAAATYLEMRDALRRGAWSEFGLLLDALGRTLGIAPDTLRR